MSGFSLIFRLGRDADRLCFQDIILCILETHYRNYPVNFIRGQGRTKEFFLFVGQQMSHLEGFDCFF